ncbi:hypothetical protein Tco_0965772 [Tanacetum coccineum]
MGNLKQDLLMIVEKQLVLEMLVDESLEMIVDESLDVIEDESLEKLVDEALKRDEEHFEFVIADSRFVGSLANSSDSLAPDVEEDHAPHNMIYGLHCYLLKDKLGYAKLKNDLVSLKSKKSLLEHEMSKLEDHLAKAQRNQNVEGSQVVKDLRFENDQILEEVSMATSLEKANFVRDFLPSVVKKLFESEHFNQALGDLQQKAITYGRSKAGQSLEELSAVEAPSIRETPSV